MIHWKTTFIGLLGNHYEIDIYDDDYTGTAVEVTADEDPFTTEEDNSDNLLTGVRVQTGYINLIETTDGELDGIYPAKIYDRYVELWRGIGANRTMVWSGYIQPQSFTADWLPCPRKVKLPIMSGLALLDNLKFDIVNPPTAIPLHNVLYQVFSKVNNATANSNGNNVTGFVVLPTKTVEVLLGPVYYEYHGPANTDVQASPGSTEIGDTNDDINTGDINTGSSGDGNNDTGETSGDSGGSTTIGDDESGGTGSGTSTQTTTIADDVFERIDPSFLDEIPEGADPSDYTEVYFPTLISSTVLSPLNKQFSRTDLHVNPYSPEYMDEFMEGFCALFNLVAHDVAGGVVFQKLDYIGTYTQFALADLNTIHPTGTVLALTGGALSQYSGQVTSDTNQLSEILPSRRVEVNEQGAYITSLGASFSHCRTDGTGGGYYGDGGFIYPLECVSNEIGSEVFVDYSNTNTGNKGVTLCVSGKDDSFQDSILIRWSTAWAPTLNILHLTWNEHLSNPWSSTMYELSISLTWGTKIADLSTNNRTLGIGFGIRIRNGNYYWTTTGWVLGDMPATPNRSISFNSANSFTAKMNISRPIQPDAPLEIFLSRMGSTEQNIDGELYNITTVKLTENPNLSDYLLDKNYHIIFDEDNGSFVDSQQTLPFHNGDNNGRLLHINSTNRVFSNYKYMLSPSTQLVLHARDNGQAQFPYLPFYRYWKNGWKWRILSIGFNAADEDYILQFIRNEELENIPTTS